MQRGSLTGPTNSGGPSFSFPSMDAGKLLVPVHIILTLFNTSASYLDRGLTPHLLDIGKQGLRAKNMKPIFPVSLFFGILCYY